jgi:hypothetical protein
MQTPPTLFDPDAIYTSPSAAAHVRARSAGRSLFGPRFFRREHAAGRLSGVNRGGRLFFTGADLNRRLGEMFEKPDPPEARVSDRVREQLRREAALQS